MTLRRTVFLLLSMLLFYLPLLAQSRGGNTSAPSSQLITIRGRIVDAETGSAVLDARVTLMAMGNFMGQGGTTQGSEFYFDNVPVTMYEIKVEADGYETLQQAFQANLGMVGSLTIPIRRVKFVDTGGRGKVVSSRLLQLPSEARDAYQSGMTQLYDKHDPEKSLALFEKTLKLAPSFYEAQFQLGVAYQNLKRTPEAETAFRGAVKTSEGKYAPPQFYLASLLSGRQDFAAAEAAARKGLESDPKSASGHYELARALLGQGKADDAETEAKASLELSNGLPQNYLLLAAIAANRGQPAEAVKQLDEYLQALPNGPLSQTVRSQREILRQQAGLAKEEAPAPSAPAKPR
jgi:tetratricopeptide (TPR) repeat protein